MPAIWLAVACLVLPPCALAQTADDSGAPAQQPGQPGNEHHGRRGDQQGASQTGPRHLVLPKLARAPRQRLDPGALFCESEADLQQHQAALMARAAGHDAPEPSGCKFVDNMAAVSVVSRDGPSRTQVRIQDEAGDTGWTDAVIPDEQTGAR